MDFKTKAEVTEIIVTSGSIRFAVGTAINTKKKKGGNIRNLLNDVIGTHRTKPEHLKQDLSAFLKRRWGIRFKFCSFSKPNLEIILFLKHCERKSEYLSIQPP